MTAEGRAKAPGRDAMRRPAGRGLARLGGLAVLAALFVGLCAATLPRDVLWHVEQTCVLDRTLTGSPFPCLEVQLGPPEGGVAVLRAPFRRTHVVAMPLVRISGIEAPELLASDAPNYLQTAWTARHYVQADASRPLAWSDVGLAVNSRATRSQDQLHIHIECVRRGLKRQFAEHLNQYPTDAWQPAGLVFQHQDYWVRRVDKPTLLGLNIFALARDIPALAADPALTILAVVGVTDPTRGDGFLLLAGRSDPTRGAAQSTSEDLLDHSCGRSG